MSPEQRADSARCMSRFMWRSTHAVWSGRCFIEATHRRHESHAGNADCRGIRVTRARAVARIRKNPGAFAPGQVRRREPAEGSPRCTRRNKGQNRKPLNVRAADEAARKGEAAEGRQERAGHKHAGAQQTKTGQRKKTKGRNKTGRLRAPSNCVRPGCARRARSARAAHSRVPTRSRCSSCPRRRWRASCAACR